jgi:hypothetical protein
MSLAQTLLRGFWRVLRPTPLQVLGSFMAALLVLIGAQSSTVLRSLGISAEAIQMASEDASHRFQLILESSLVSHVALVAFWAAIGLMAYLVCWAGYNLWISARNEVTIETQYTNKGQWDSMVETLAVKAVASLGLVLYLLSFQVLLAGWLTLTSGVLNNPTTPTALMAGLAVVGMAVQLYGLIILLQLAFTPWYRPEAFTD